MKNQFRIKLKKNIFSKQLQKKKDVSEIDRRSTKVQHQQGAETEIHVHRFKTTTTTNKYKFIFFQKKQQIFV